MSSVLWKVRRAVADVRTFGPRFHLRHISRLRGMEPHSVVMPDGGRVWLRPATTDADVLRQIYQSHEYELRTLNRYSDIVARYESILEHGRTPVIIDAGANIGIASLWFAKMFPQAHVVAVEPEPANAAMCRMNVASTAAISVRQAAIGSTSGRIELDNPAGKAWSPRSSRSDNGDIEIVTVGELVAEIPNGTIFIAKIDIEGFESDLFSANLDWIDRISLLIIEIHDWMLTGGATSFGLQRAMGERRFEMIISGENLIYYNTADDNFTSGSAQNSAIDQVVLEH